MIRLYIEQPLRHEQQLALTDKQAHYLGDVMRLKTGDAVSLFNGHDGEWRAVITDATKRSMSLRCEQLLRPQYSTPDMMVCFAPPRGGRIDSIIEKATELGAHRLQPVRTERSVVDKVNQEKWALTVREAAEQSERLDVPHIAPMVTLPQLLGAWDTTRPLLYGDESGASGALESLVLPTPVARWAILTGPEGGFSEAEIALLTHTKGTYGVGLGPRILRTDTAVITLCAITQARFGDWHARPRFEPHEKVRHERTSTEPS